MTFITEPPRPARRNPFVGLIDLIDWLDDAFRRLMSVVTGRPIVELIDSWGETRRRLVWRDALGRPCATWIGFRIREVVLCPDGTLLNGSYVKRWIPIRGNPYGELA